MIHNVLEIRVVEPLPNGSDRCLLGKQIELNNGLNVSYETIVTTLRFMYGSKVVINFSLSSYESKN